MRALRHLLRDRPLFRAPVIRTRMLLRPRPVNRGGVVFLMYHRLPPLHRAGFERQLEWLAALGNLVPLPQGLAALAWPPAPRPLISLTFDDGWADAALHAAPALSECRVPATFFVVSDWVGQRGRVSWAALRELCAAGMTVGSHGASHARLSGLDDRAAAEELRRSRDTIEQRTGQHCLHFAAPFGQPNEDYNPRRDPALARAAGYQSFFCSVPRRAVPGQDRAVLPRIRMEPGWSRAEIDYALWR